MTKSIRFKKTFLKKFKKQIYIFVGIFIFFIFILFLIAKNFSFKIDEKIQIEPKQKIVAGHDLSGELFFNDMNSDLRLSKIIMESVEKSKKSIDIAMYSIDFPKFVEVLKNKQEKDNIAVNIVVPNKKSIQHDEVFKDTKFNILEIGKQIKDSESETNLMHHKFIIFDAKTDEKELIFGSYNLTETQEVYDPCFLFMTKDKHVTEAFSEEFNFLENKKSGFKKLSTRAYKPFSRRIEYTNGFFEIWFGPGYKENSVKYKIIDLIKNANKKIEILAWQLNDRDIFKAISDKAKEGVEVYIIADDFYLWTEESVIKDFFGLKKNTNTKINTIADSFYTFLVSSEYLKEDKRVLKFNPFLHHHTIIVDDSVVVTGTNNWGLAGFYANDESIVVTDVDWFVKEYNEYFDFIYKKLKNKDVVFEVLDDNLILKESYPENSRLIIYQEESYPEVVGKTCLNTEIKNGQNYKIPKICLDEQIKIFIISDKGELIASDYIYNK